MPYVCLLGHCGPLSSRPLTVKVPRALPHLARGHNPPTVKRHHRQCDSVQPIVSSQLFFVCLKMELNGAVRHYAAVDNLLKCWGCWAGLLRSDTVTPGGGGAHSERGAEESAADRSSVWLHRRKTDAPENTRFFFFKLVSEWESKQISHCHWLLLDQKMTGRDQPKCYRFFLCYVRATFEHNIFGTWYIFRETFSSSSGMSSNHSSHAGMTG